MEIHVKYSLEWANVPSVTRPPNKVSMASWNMRYSAISTAPLTMETITALPMLPEAFLSSRAPRLRLTKVQQPSPIITAMASATTVSG